MATSKKSPGSGVTGKRPAASSGPKAAGEKGASSAKQSMSGPSAKPPPQPRRSLAERAATAMGGGTSSEDADVRNLAVADRLQSKVDATEEMVASIPHNANKRSEYAIGGEPQPPPEGRTEAPKNNDATGSTITESNESEKNGAKAAPGTNPNNGPLEKHRVDSGGRSITTNQGVPVADNQHSLRLGLRGPTLLEDFILREKITHFDHERIPERVVHARGSGAHGYFECTEDITDLTRAAPFAAVGKRTPVFVRFSTVAGERGSADAVRDVRGFAVKFYTDEGNWDLVGNNIPVFFIQDAMKFPDLVHAVKPEPHHQMPQAASAHDTFWDFISLMPESMHMVMWAMSDRGIPRSYRTMQGFGVHTFRLVNANGEAVLVKFHWTPVAGTHSLDWDEAVRINGADPDFHRRDLWEAIEGGAFPEYLLQIQTFSEEQAEAFSFDVLDATKIVPEETRAAAHGGPPGAEPQPRQLLRRDRADRLLHAARGARHRLHERPAAAGPQLLLPRHAALRAWAARTSTRSRSTRRSSRCTTTSATACIARPSTADARTTSPIRSAAAARSRPAPRASPRSPSGCSSSRPRPSPRSCAPSPRSSPSTSTRLGFSTGARRPRSRRTSCAGSASSSRRSRRKPCAKGWSPCCATSTSNWRCRWRTSSACRCRRRCRRSRRRPSRKWRCRPRCR